jgi:hypothetical protein
VLPRVKHSEAHLEQAIAAGAPQSIVYFNEYLRIFHGIHRIVIHNVTRDVEVASSRADVTQFAIPARFF